MERESQRKAGVDRWCGRRGPQTCLVAPEFSSFRRGDITEQNLPKDERTDPQIYCSVLSILWLSNWHFVLSLQSFISAFPRKSRQATERHCPCGLRFFDKVVRSPASGASISTRWEESTIGATEMFWERLDMGGFLEAGEMPVLAVEIKALCWWLMWA